MNVCTGCAEAPDFGYEMQKKSEYYGVGFEFVSAREVVPAHGFKLRDYGSRFCSHAETFRLDFTDNRQWNLEFSRNPGRSSQFFGGDG
jgi:hypothetical protein